MNRLHMIRELVVQGDQKKLVALVKQSLDEGYPAEEILDSGLVSGMGMVGSKMEKEEMYIPEVLLSANALKGALNILQPVLNQEKVAERKTVIVGTVRGDVHDIGKDLVLDMLQGAGFNIIDLGINVPVSGFLEAVRSRKPEILGMSAMLTTTMQEMKKVIQALDEEGLRKTVKVIVGGAPVNHDWAMRIGADAYGEDCVSAVMRAKELVQIS